MQYLSDEKSPSGILFTVSLLQNTYDKMLANPETAIVYLEKISDPGNLGTLVRTAAWFGITSILLSPDCVDPYNPKTVRSSTGAIFICDMYRDIPFERVYADFKKRKYQFIATSPSNGIPLEHWRIPQRSLLFFGQEADGLSPNIVQKADILLSIEGSGNIESLNVSVSAGIIMHYLNKHMTES